MTSDRSSFGSHLNLSLDRLRQRVRQRIRREPQDKPQLLELLRDAKQRAVLDTDALSMIEGVLQVSDLRVRDIMIPRAEMTFIRRDDPLNQILKVVVETAHSRFPVIGDDKGDVVGVLIAKDLLAFCDSDKRRPFILRDLVRSAVFVPESKRLNVLLKEFRSSRSHMAIVVDEYGTAAGLVTIEDVLEQIVGEIDDEHDYDEGAFIYRRSANEYTIKARTTVEDFNAYFNCDLSDEAFDTIGGLVVHAMGRLPKGGERVRVEGFRFTIKRADSRRVHLLTVERIEPTEEAEELPEGQVDET
jgi:magnesium and cobalt transporter